MNNFKQTPQTSGKSFTEEPATKTRGRAAGFNPPNRFESLQQEAFDDGWFQEPDSPIRTEVLEDHSKGILSHNQSPDVPFDWSINPYRGCEHGCIYCYARPSHAYWGLSPGLDFESRIFAKRDAAELLRHEFEKPSYQAKVIALGANTDPYQPLERQLKITRSILETMHTYRHPVAIITKSAGVLRDLDLLSALAQQNLASVAVSVTTLCDDVARSLEPRAAAPARRVHTIHQLTQAGIPVTVLVAPIIPAINDWELERILETAAAAGATRAGYILLRLPHEVAPLFEDWLQREFPDKFDHVMSLIHQMRGGQLNVSRFKERMKGTGPIAALLQQRFQLAMRRLNLTLQRHALTTDLFRRPPKTGDQLNLFDSL